MKKCIVVLASLALMFAFCIPVVAQPSAKSLEAVVIDNFDNADDMEWTWKVQASRFVTKEGDTQYPLVNYFNGIPNSLVPYHKDAAEAKVLGVKVKFDRKGENWFEIYPEYNKYKDKNGNPIHEIPFEGTVSQIDFWVWGAHYLYYLEVIVRDAAGVVHVLPAGNLNFNGWRNVIVYVPGNILQHSPMRSGLKNMTLMGFRVRADAKENVDDFTIYLDQIKYTTNSLDNVYDGFNLRYSDFGDGDNYSGHYSAE